MTLKEFKGLYCNSALGLAGLVEVIKKLLRKPQTATETITIPANKYFSSEIPFNNPPKPVPAIQATNMIICI